MNKRTRAKFLVSAVIVLLALSFLQGLAMLSVFVVGALIPYALNAAHSTGSRIVACGIVFVAAALLFVLRKHNKYLYGVLELLLGAVVVWHSLARLEVGGLAPLSAFCAGVYLLVRAFTNMDEGYLTMKAAQGAATSPAEAKAWDDRLRTSARRCTRKAARAVRRRLMQRGGSS
jgi:hypothetical protein